MNLRVLTLNIGSLIEPNWEERRYEIVAWIDHLTPDVVCFQEVWQSDTTENTAGWIANQSVIDWHWSFGGGGVAPFSPDTSLLFGSAVLSRWPITNSTFHRLDWHTPTATRIIEVVPWELFHVETAGLDVFSTHLAPAPTDLLHRRIQVKQIHQIITASRGDKDTFVRGQEPRTEMPPILCGDFNAEPDSDEIRFLIGLTDLDGEVAYYQDAWRVAGDHGPGLTQDWRINETARELNLHRKRIDYVFVGDPYRRAGSAGRVESCQVVADTSLTGDIVASDHAGVLAEIVWPDRP